MVPRPLHLRALALAAVAACLACAFGQDVSAADKPKGAPIDVFVIGQGMPVPGASVTLAPDKGGAPESWNVAESTPLAVVTTDGTGHAKFPDVPPGKYIVTSTCALPGDWIAGNYATKIETLPGRPANVTLTARRGSMLRGKAVQGSVPAGHAEIRADSPDALLTTCGMMTSSDVDTTTGTFTVSKIPLNATTWLKADLPFGPGRIGVWKDFHSDKAETVDVAVKFPEIGPNDVGSLVLDLKAGPGEKPDSGSAQLLLVMPDNAWRYESTVGVGGVNGAVTVKGLPKGNYQIRAYAIPGSSEWWNAAIETLSVVPGKTINHPIKVTVRR